MSELNMQICQKAGEITANFDEIKGELSARMDLYKDAVYTADMVPTAKKEVAALRKLKTAIETRRKEVKKEQMKPYEEFEKKCKELTGLIDEPIGLISEQVDEYTRRQKAEKKKKIEDMFADMVADLAEYIKFEQIFDEKWLNASVSIKSIKEAIEVDLDACQMAVETIQLQNSDKTAEALEIYKKNLDLGEAFKFLTNYERQKAEILKAEQEKQERERRLAEERERERIRQEERRRIQEEERIRREERERIEAEERAKAEAEAREQTFEVDSIKEDDIEEIGGFDVMEPVTEGFETEGFRQDDGLLTVQIQMRVDAFTLAEIEQKLEELGVKYKKGVK